MVNVCNSLSISHHLQNESLMCGCKHDMISNIILVSCLFNSITICVIKTIIGFPIADVQ